MKKVIFDVRTVINVGTDEYPITKEWLSRREFLCADEEVEDVYAIARREAYNGEVTVEDIPESPEEQIVKLKAELESTDYKIIKCSEAQLVGDDLPYDIVALHAERQALRDRINELESGGDST